MNIRSVALIAVVILIAGAVSLWAIKEEQIKLAANLEARIQEQQKVVADIALQTDGNGADEDVSAIIHDCRSRDEFESLLVRLDSLSRIEMGRVLELFDACGDFFSVTKAVMVSKLDREFQLLIDFNELYTELTGETTYLSDIERWRQVVELEMERSDLLAEQVTIQGAIITDLQSGVRPQDEVITNRINRAQEIAELLLVTNQRIDTLRDDGSAS